MYSDERYSDERSNNLFDWIDEHEDVFLSDKDPLPIACKYIMMQIIFMDRDQFIRTVVKQKYVIPTPTTTDVSNNETRIIPNTTLIRMIETHRGQFDKPGQSRYKLADIALFHVPVNHANCSPSSWWRIISSIEDVVLPPSLYFFQNTHCIWVFLQETVRVPTPAITYTVVAVPVTVPVAKPHDEYTPDKLAMLNKHLQTRRRNLRLLSKQHTRRHVVHHGMVVD